MAMLQAICLAAILLSTALPAAKAAVSAGRDVQLGRRLQQSGGRYQPQLGTQQLQEPQANCPNPFYTIQCSSPFSPSGYLSCTFAPCSLFQSSCVPGQLPQSPGANLPRTTPAPTPPPTTPPPTSAVPTPSCGVNNILGGQVPVCAATTHYGAGFAGVWVVPLAHTCDGARLTGLTVSTSGTFNPAGLVTNMANPDAVSGLANCSAPSVDSSGQLTGPSPRVVCSLANPTAQLSDFTTGTLPLASVNDGTAAGVPSRFQFAYLDPETPCGDARDPAAPAWTFTVESASFERVP